VKVLVIHLSSTTERLTFSFKREASLFEALSRVLAGMPTEVVLSTVRDIHAKPKPFTIRQ
jgi:hypothetical protein